MVTNRWDLDPNHVDVAWGDDRPPGTPCRDTIIYELHVKGFTQARRDVPAQLRGTYACETAMSWKTATSF